VSAARLNEGANFFLEITQAGARLRLAQLEGLELESGADVALHPEVSASVLIGMGLDLEEQQ
jgi:hypothetical protein